MPRHALLVGLALCAPMAALATPADAQAVRSQHAGAEQPVRTGVVLGDILDATSAAPLAGATVILDPVRRRADTPSRGPSAFTTAARTTTTTADGRYRFTDVAPGKYRLVVQRMGYRSTAIELTIEAVAESRISVGLAAAPVELDAVRVESTAVFPETPMQSLVPSGEDSSRVAAARARQREFLSADVREITRGEVRDAVTLGESDLLRALQRLPGVSTRNEETAELWVRGARWDLTRISFDGVPLFAPFHAIAHSGVGADAVGSAVLLSGVRPVALDAGAAANLELRSRAGGGSGALRGAGSIDLIGASLTLEQRRRNGRAAWLVSARRTHADLLGATRVPYTPTTAMAPRRFGDLTTRVDLALGAGMRLEASGLLSGATHHTVQSVATYSETRSGTTGNSAGRVSLIHDGSAFETRHTLAASRTDFANRTDYVRLSGDESATGYHDWDAELSAIFARGELLSRTRVSDAAQWQLGYSLTRVATTHKASLHHSASDFPRADSTVETGDLTMVALWSERRWQPTRRFVLSTGLRLDAGGRFPEAPFIRPMPRLEARLHADSQTSVSVAAGRHWQYVQTFFQGSEQVESVQISNPLWILADGQRPAVRADIVSVGMERWTRGDILLSGVAYARSLAGLSNRELEGARAVGVDLSARKLAGAMTGQVGYSLARSMATSAGERFASTQDRRHVLDATIRQQITRKFGFSAAYAFATGAPFTRQLALGYSPGDSATLVPQPKNAGRDVDFHGLDLGIDWGFHLGPIDGAVYAQFRNVVGRQNTLDYISSGFGCAAMQPAFESSRCHDDDLFELGRSRFPFVGLRLRF